MDSTADIGILYLWIPPRTSVYHPCGFHRGHRKDQAGQHRPGQRFAVVAIEVCTRLLSRDSEVTTRWVPAHHGVPGNEKADEHVEAAAEGVELDNAAPDEYPLVGANLGKLEPCISVQT